MSDLEERVTKVETHLAELARLSLDDANRLVSLLENFESLVREVQAIKLTLLRENIRLEVPEPEPAE